MKAELELLKTEVLEQQGRVHWVELGRRWHQLKPDFPRRSAASLKQKWKRIQEASTTSTASNSSPGVPPSAMSGVVSIDEHNRVLEELKQLKETVALNSSVESQHAPQLLTAAEPTEPAQRHLVVFIDNEREYFRVSASVLADALKVLMLPEPCTYLCTPQ